MASSQELIKLAGYYGVQTAYYGMNRQRHSASVESLISVLKLVGAHVEKIGDVATAARDYEQEQWRSDIF